MAAYVKKFLLGDAEAETGVLMTDGGFSVDEARWVDWDVPSLD